MSSCAMWSRFLGDGAAFASGLPTAFICAAFLLQFLGATFLSYLLFVSTVRLDNPAARLVLHVLNALLWISALIADISVLASKLYFTQTLPATLYLGEVGNYTAVLLFIGAMLVGLALYVVFVVGLRTRLDFDRNLERASVVLTAVIACAGLIVNFMMIGTYHPDIVRLSGLIAIAAGLIAIERFTRDRLYARIADAVLCLDAFFMLFGSYADITARSSIVVSLAYVAVLLAAIYLQYRLVPEPSRSQVVALFKGAGLAIFELSMLAVLSDAYVTYQSHVKLLVLTGTLLLLYLVGFARLPEDENSAVGVVRSAVGIASPVSAAIAASRARILHYLVRANEFLLFFVDAWFIAYRTKNLYYSSLMAYDTYAPFAVVISEILYALLAAMVLALIVLRLRDAAHAQRHDYSFLEFLLGLSFTFIVLALIQGDTLLFNQGYMLSVICMLTALACIVVGFSTRMKSLRLYGLIVVMLCVLKLVTLDLSTVNSMTRVAAFIGGGVICFAISALYNYTVKRFDAQG